MKKSFKGTFLTIVITALVTIIVIAILLFALPGGLGNTFFKLVQIDFLVKNNYFGDTSEIDFDTALCDGYVSQLEDSYAQYYPVEESEEKFDSFDGDKSGIGITFVVHPDDYNYFVVSVSSSGPADKAGITAGDRIVAVNGKEITKTNYKSMYDALTGEVGNSTKITIMRNEETFDVEVMFDHYVLQTVFSKMIGDIGYVDIDSFNLQTDEQFIKAVDDLISKGAKSLIFDLRNNPGGTADSVASIVDYIVPKGDILSVNYINGKSEVMYTSDDSEINLPMAVLVNENTASAAEIFAASVRDFEKGVLIGNTTYGKGIMQKTFKLTDSSAVKFTVAEYVTKSGISYNDIGIKPDYNIELDEYQSRYMYFLSDGENPYILKAVEVLNEN